MQLPVFLLLLGAALILQTTVLDFVAIKGVKPDLVALLVVLNGFLLGPREGAFLGFAGGILEDLISGSYIGMGALSKMLSGYLAGAAGERFYRESVLIATGVAFIAASAGSVVHYLLLLYLGIYVPPFDALLRVVLPSALYTALLAPFVFWRVLRSVRFHDRDF